jgi:type IV secretory pathway VirJ component
MPQFLAAHRKLAPAAPAPTSADVADLPLVEVPATAGSSDLVAVLITGDGGWAGLDQDVAAALAARGVPVVALNSLKYFWSPHDAAETARDVDRIVRASLTRFRKQRVVLLGYSQGADVMPFVLNRLAPDTRAKAASAAVIGMSDAAVFEFHFANWVKDPKGLPTRPEVEKLDGVKLTCIYGAEEHDSPCATLDPHKVVPVKLPGGHHFNGDYDRVANAVLGTIAGF